MNKAERLLCLEGLLKTIALQLLQALEPEAAKAVLASRRHQAKKESQVNGLHGPYCDKAQLLKRPGEKKSSWVYCGEVAGHTGPCNPVREIPEIPD